MAALNVTINKTRSCDTGYKYHKWWRLHFTKCSTCSDLSNRGISRKYTAFGRLKNQICHIQHAPTYKAWRNLLRYVGWILNRERKIRVRAQVQKILLDALARRSTLNFEVEMKTSFNSNNEKDQRDINCDRGVNKNRSFDNINRPSADWNDTPSLGWTTTWIHAEWKRWTIVFVDML